MKRAFIPVARNEKKPLCKVFVIDLDNTESLVSFKNISNHDLIKEYQIDIRGIAIFNNKICVANYPSSIFLLNRNTLEPEEVIHFREDLVDGIDTIKSRDGLLYLCGLKSKTIAKWDGHDIIDTMQLTYAPECISWNTSGDEFHISNGNVTNVTKNIKLEFTNAIDLDFIDDSRYIIKTNEDNLVSISGYNRSFIMGESEGYSRGIIHDSKRGIVAAMHFPCTLKIYDMNDNWKMINKLEMSKDINDISYGIILDDRT